MESVKECFKKMLNPNWSQTSEMERLIHCRVYPYMFYDFGVSPHSLAKALVYPKALQVAFQEYGFDCFIGFLYKMSKITSRVTYNNYSGLDFVDAIDGRKKHCYYCCSTELTKERLDSMLSYLRRTYDKKKRDDPSFEMDDMVVGVLLGERNDLSPYYRTLETTWPVYCGAEFWEHFIGDKHFYSRLFNAFVEVVEQENLPECDYIRKKVEEIAQEIEKMRA